MAANRCRGNLQQTSSGSASAPPPSCSWMARAQRLVDLLWTNSIFACASGRRPRAAPRTPRFRRSSGHRRLNHLAALRARGRCPSRCVGSTRRPSAGSRRARASLRRRRARACTRSGRCRRRRRARQRPRLHRRERDHARGGGGAAAGGGGAARVAARRRLEVRPASVHVARRPPPQAPAPGGRRRRDRRAARAAPLRAPVRRPVRLTRRRCRRRGRAGARVGESSSARQRRRGRDGARPTRPERSGELRVEGLARHRRSRRTFDLEGRAAASAAAPSRESEKSCTADLAGRHREALPRHLEAEDASAAATFAATRSSVTLPRCPRWRAR